MAKWWCLLARKNYMFRPMAAIFRFWQFSAKRVLYNMPKPRGDIEISTSPGNLGILYKTVLAENCQNLKMAAIGRNM